MTYEEKQAKVDQTVKEEVHNQTDAHGALFAALAVALFNNSLAPECRPAAQALFNKVNDRCLEEIPE